MTDRELLLANNEKIREIQETLKNKILALEVNGKIIEVNLPEELAVNENFYTFQISKDSILFSGSLREGLWRYNVFSNTWEKIYENGVGWQKFQETKLGYLISSDTEKYGLLFYDKGSKSVTQIYHTGRNWIYCINVDGKWLISSISSYSNSKGILLFDENTITAKIIYDIGYRWEYYKIVEGGCLLSSSSQPLLFYDSKTETISQIFEGVYWYHFNIIGDYCLIGSESSGSGSLGILSFNIKTHTITKIYETGFRWHYFHNVGKHCIISSSDSKVLGLLSFNSETNTIKVLLEDSYNWQYHKIVGDICLLGSWANSTGLLEYDSLTDSIIKLYDSGYRFSRFLIFEDKVFISSNGTAGLWVYNILTRTLSTPFNSGIEWKYMFHIGDNVLFTGDNIANGLISYNLLNNTATRILTQISNLDKCEMIDNYYYLESEDKTKNRKIIRYNPIDNKAERVGYYLEVNND